MKVNKPKQLAQDREIVAHWTYAARSRVPDAFPLPSELPSATWPIRYHRPPEALPRSTAAEGHAPDIYVYLVRSAERNQPDRPVAQYWMALASRLPDDSTLRLSGWKAPLFTVSGVEDGLQILVARDTRRSISPTSTSYGNRLCLLLGNGCRCDWRYAKRVLNIGAVDALVSSLFVNGSTAHRFLETADLHQCRASLLSHGREGRGQGRRGDGGRCSDQRRLAC
jgi:hypothetical protein